MIGVPGTAHRLFGALREEGISVILISQGSSEHSICFAVPEVAGRARRAVVRRAFDRELRGGPDPERRGRPRASILAVVGDGMAGAPGVAAQGVQRARLRGRQRPRHRAGRLGAQHLGRHRRPQQATRALRAVHSSFYLSPHTISIGVIGPGSVGSVLLDQLAVAGRTAARATSTSTCGCAASSARSTCCSCRAAIDLARLARRVRRGRRPADFERFADHVHVGSPAAHGDHRLQRRARRWRSTTREWLAAGIHVVTPNKKANSAELWRTTIA